MIGAVIRWFRLVWPPAWAPAVIVLFVGFLEALHFWVRSVAPHDATQLLEARNFLISGALILYGAFRVIAFHPLFRPDYRKWLMLTPWSHRDPLPMGPVFPTAQDLVALSLAVLAMHGSPLAPRVAAVAAFVTAYVILTCFTLFCTQIWVEAYLLAFGLGLAVRMAAWNEGAAVIVLSVLFPVALAGLWRSFQWFPWDERVEKIGRKLVSVQDPQQSMIGTGWPFDYLNPQPKSWRIPLRHGVLISLLIGWWFYAFHSLAPVHDRGFEDLMLSIYCLISGVFLAVRVVMYCGVYWMPISLWGRLWTGRWIIPGYDRVLVAPLCGLAVLLTGLMIPDALLSQGPVLGASLALVVMTCLTMGPRLEQWRLTGAHRLVSSGIQSKEYERL